MNSAQAVMSMTGYAHSEGQTGPFGWRLDLKSVNGKGLDLRVRVPAGFEAFEVAARAALTRLVRRGSLSLGLTIEAGHEASGARLNRPLLEDVLKVAKDLGSESVRLEHLLAVRGVIETGENRVELTPELQAELEQGLQGALAMLLEARRSEGQHLHAVLAEHLDMAERLTAAAKLEAGRQPVLLRDKWLARLQELAGSHSALTPERVAQEAALLASRVDITEELNRLTGHIAAMRALLREGGPVGRKLDFLCQELNREANTVCSKSESLALTNTGVELKVVIEQIREQVQNVE